MRHASAVISAALVAVFAAAPLTAQAPAPVPSTPTAALDAKALPPIPAARQFLHWGHVETSYDDDENSTSISLSLAFDHAQRDAFARPGHGVDTVEMDVGYVHAGKVMTAAPEVVTIVIKMARATEAALDFDKKFTGDAQVVIDGTEPLTFSAPLVQRNAVSSSHGRIREVLDTYAIVITLRQYLRIVNGQKVTARMGEQIFDFTGGPLEGMRDVASRIVVTP